MSHQAQEFKNSIAEQCQRVGFGKKITRMIIARVDSDPDLHQAMRGWVRRAGRPAPRTIYLLRVKKAHIPGRLRKAVFERDGYRCRQCNDWHDLHVDHIIPESLNGPTILENLQTLCARCNCKKGNRYVG